MLRLLCFIVALSIASTLHAEEVIGKRPYEMVNAGRNADTHPPLVDFQNVDGWTIETVESEATFTRSQEQKIFGDYVAKLVYKHTPTEARKTPIVTVRPPQPLEIGKALDCVNWWVYGNNWAWESDTSTPRVNLTLVLRGNENREVRVSMDTVRWREWFLMHRKLTAEQLTQLGETPKLEAIEIRGGSNKQDRTLYFGNLSFYKEELKPLSFEPRPKRGIEFPEGQGTGTNTGPGKLPFPNREETILPTNLVKEFKNSAMQRDEEGKPLNLFRYEAADGIVQWTYKPETGTLDDLTMTWYPKHGQSMRRFSFYESGLKFTGTEAPPKGELQSVDWKENVLTVRWKFGSEEAEYRFQMQQKTLIVDVRCRGGKVEEVVFGNVSATKNPRLIPVPYLVGNGTSRPMVLVDGETDDPLFFFSMVDHTRSNASELFFVNKIDDHYATVNGGARYKLKTDGTRNDCFERLFITVSPIFEEVLPNIPNDPSPWQHVTGERVWKAHGASNHDRDYEYWKRVHRYGVRKMLITDHETLWRDGGESFTFRTYAAPGKGGDKGQKEYKKRIQALGYVYGPYNNYTDYAPVNEFWNEDWVTRLSDGNFHPAWARCYNPKPAIAVQTEPKITEIVQKKFHFNTAYCDVHTAVQPWRYVDYDARVPGAGTFCATFFAYGEIMLHQKKIWGGPVYSEGNNHWYYSGLTDGNYGQDQAYFVHQAELPWLVDFDLLKMHPLENNFGMGNVEMFYGRRTFKTAEERLAGLDRFLAATLAFGHTGFLAMETGHAGGMRSYFAVQQLAKRYANQPVKSIRYADENGKLLTTSEAVAADKVKLNRIRVEYEDGFTLYVNGNEKMPWEVGRLSPKGGVARQGDREPREDIVFEQFQSASPTLPFGERQPTNMIPPNGWCVVDPKKEITAWSLDRDGKRTDYVDSPDYLFAEVRDNPQGTPQRFDRLLCDRQLIVLKNVDEQKRWEMIVGEANYSARSTLHAVRLDNEADADAVALDFERKEIGKAETRYSRGMVHVLPVDGAFSYLLTPKKKPETVAASKRIQVVPGETVDVENFGAEKTAVIPNDAKTGSLHWIEKDGRRLDFDVVPLADVSAKIDVKEKKITFKYRTNLPGANPRIRFLQGIEFDRLQGNARFPFDSEKPHEISFDLDIPTEPKVVPMTFALSNGEMKLEKKYWLKTDLGFAELPALSERFELGQCQRGKEPTAFDGKSGAYAHLQTVSCGDTSRKAWAIHPPYSGGVGYVYMLSEPFAVPDLPEIVFSSEVGIRNGGDPSDGVLYQVFVVEEGQENKLVGEINWAKREWTPLVCDLSPWRGKTVRLRLIADVGPKNNSSADWACWSEFKLVSLKPTLLTTLHEQPVELAYIPSQEPIRSLDDFTKAEKVELHYEGCGMDASDRYHSTATMNGVELGRLPGAGGNETKGVWAGAVVPLPPEAVKALGEINRLEIRSTEDCFKVRRFQIVATFADGSKRSTMLTNRTVTHPGNWKYAEGESVSMGQPIKVDLLAK